MSRINILTDIFSLRYDGFVKSKKKWPNTENLNPMYFASYLKASAIYHRISEHLKDRKFEGC